MTRGCRRSGHLGPREARLRPEAVSPRRLSPPPAWVAPPTGCLPPSVPVFSPPHPLRPGYRLPSAGCRITQLRLSCRSEGRNTPPWLRPVTARPLSPLPWTLAPGPVNLGLSESLPSPSPCHPPAALGLSTSLSLGNVSLSTPAHGHHHLPQSASLSALRVKMPVPS